MAIWWIAESVAIAIHEEQLAEHGGPIGVRGAGLLQSALNRPRNLAGYGEPDLAALAAAYGHGIVRNHPFVDGNKRTALVITELFLLLNGAELLASDADCVVTILGLAEGKISESSFAEWIRAHLGG